MGYFRKQQKSMARTVVHFAGGLVFGGVEQVLLTMLRGLDRERWPSVLYYYSDAQISPLLEGARAAGVVTRPVPRAPNESRLHAVFRLARMLRAEKCTIFHAHLPLPEYCRVALMAAALARVPVIIATAQLFGSAPSRLSMVCQRILTILIDQYIAVSHDLSRHLVSGFGLPPAKITVIHNGIPSTDSVPTRMSDRLALASEVIRRPIVLTCARLHEQKGLMYLLEAASLVPEATFVIAGDGPQRAQLEARVSSLRLNGRVRFLGYRDDVPTLLACCEIFVLPSLSEALPLSILEAMRAAKPVIASNVGGVGEVIVDGKTGLLVPPARPELLAHAIRMLLADPSYAAQLAVAGRARMVQAFSAEVMLKRVVQVYEQLCHVHICVSKRD